MSPLLAADCSLLLTSAVFLPIITLPCQDFLTLLIRLPTESQCLVSTASLCLYSSRLNPMKLHPSPCFATTLNRSFSPPSPIHIGGLGLCIGLGSHTCLLYTSPSPRD